MQRLSVVSMIVEHSNAIERRLDGLSLRVDRPSPVDGERPCGPNDGADQRQHIGTEPGAAGYGDVICNQVVTERGRQELHSDDDQRPLLTPIATNEEDQSSDEHPEIPQNPPDRREHRLRR